MKAGAKSNTIQNGSFHDNVGFGIKLEDATFNKVTENALYHNNAGPIDSPATQLAPVFYSAFSDGAVTQDGQMNFSVAGQQSVAVNHVEIFRLNPQAGNTTNFVKSASNFDLFLRFSADIPATNGEQIFAIAIGNDGTTSSATAFNLNPMAFGSSGCSLSSSLGNSPTLSYLISLMAILGVLAWRRMTLARFQQRS